jgi:hypothetical protein
MRTNTSEPAGGGPAGATRVSAGPVLGGLIVGTLTHGLAIALFFVFWQSARAEAPRCFPDEDGVAVVLMQTLDVDAVGLVVCIVLAVVLRNRGFTRGIICGWVLGLVLVVLGTAEILQFRQSLGMGCGGGFYRAPW